MEIQLRCRRCESMVSGATDDRVLACECGAQYMASVTPVDVPDSAVSPTGG